MPPRIFFEKLTKDYHVKFPPSTEVRGKMSVDILFSIYKAFF
jgi:hypothetical protein